MKDLEIRKVIPIEEYLVEKINYDTLFKKSFLTFFLKIIFLPIFIFIKILKLIFKENILLSYPDNSSLSPEAKNTFKKFAQIKKIKGFQTRKILGYDLFISQIISSNELSNAKGSIGTGFDKNKKKSETIAFGGIY